MTREEAIEILKYSIGVFPVTDRAVSALNMAVKALEQEPCEDAISRQAILDIIEDKIKYGLAQLDPDEIVAISQYYHMEVEKLPSVKPQEPKNTKCEH